MRRSFNGLAIDARERVGGDPTSGSLFVFFNRNRTISKTIWWDTGGFCIFAKKLSKGRFKIPAPPLSGAQHVEMDAKDVALLLAGIDLSRVKRQKKWNPKKKKRALLPLYMCEREGTGKEGKRKTRKPERGFTVYDVAS